VISFEPLSPKLASLCLQGKFFNYSMSNVHATTALCLEKQMDEFCDILEKTYENLPKNDIKLII
jgi:hypothetical protein